MDSPTQPDSQNAYERAKALAHFLDDAIEVPGLGVRIGWDGIIGLIPGIGDLATTILSLLIIFQAMQAGVPSSVAVRMAGNVGLDVLAGAIPVVGDLLDFGVKSNRRNIRLLESYFESPQSVRKHSRLWIAGLLSLLALCLFSLIFLVWNLASWLIRSIA